MPSTEEWFYWLYPYYADEADPRHVPYVDIEWAIAAALPWRPTCPALTPEQQNEAQASYAASLLEYRALQALVAGGGAGSTGGSSSVATGAVIRERKREGDVEVEKQYSTSGSTSSSALNTAARNANAGPSAAYARWLSYWSICNPADILVVGPPDTSNVEAPPRRGGLITRWGLPPTG